VNYVERLSFPTSGVVVEKRAPAEFGVNEGCVNKCRFKYTGRFRLGRERVKGALEAKKRYKGNVHH
jgi:hypothetical protein